MPSTRAESSPAEIARECGRIGVLLACGAIELVLRDLPESLRASKFGLCSA